MGNPETIHRLLTDRSPAPICDDCLSAETQITPRQQINIIARSLGLTTDFDRQGRQLLGMWGKQARNEVIAICPQGLEAANA